MEQKLSVIMAADVAGYSRLMELDEKGTLAALMAHRRELWDVEVAAHHGRIVKLIGDGMLVEFRAVEDAVLCAVEIQRGMRSRNAGIRPDRRMEFRIGINIGDMLFEDGDVYGDGVNVAARIEGLAKPGGVSVSSSVYDTLGGRLGIRFEDTGAQALKNIGRPVHIYNVFIDDAGSGPAVLMAPPSQEVRENPPVKSGRTLLHVSRFANLSGNPDREYFAAGITQDVVAALSRFSGLNVIVRAPRVEPQHHAAACYSLEGSVRRVGDRVRVNANLTNATGEHIWAEKYDFDLIDMFDVQDELSRSIPAALNVKIEEAERYRVLAEPLKGSSAYDFYLRGRHIEKSLKPDEIRLAKEMFLAAIDADPAYARGYLGLAWLEIRKLKWNERVDMEATLASAFASASKALELSPYDADIHWALGVVHLWRGEADRAIGCYERGRELAPNNCDLLAEYCDALGYLGLLEDAIRIGELALRLNPSRPDWYFWNIAASKYLSGQYSEALALLEKMAELGSAYRLLAATYAQLGRLEEARRAAAELLKLNPEFSIERYSSRTPYRDKALLARYVEGLRLAELPE
ncbi:MULTISPECIES: adenylate/guanylate cyclase domain-containing protein [unclassified Ensifer]|uniref:adenylate/guanylate cyclase domain-containing protein n=1 Tax=unclassified Ensifer TaxID=2633371 RepID=UPI00070AE497|nr:MULTISPECIES: adenylate/guanylate cyclase domain-containing protein [unclassified Ensifer]KRD49451.1 adenylate cyclase [Ensifer sp. Root278]MBV7517924.1 adenylate/guanylate cyclase domain-containing protein [Ensifer sp. ENS12]